jgi:hypothetical protein
MMKFLHKLFFALLLAGFGLPVVFAQDSEPAEDEDGSSERVEQSDDAFRRQMELEDARSRDRTYVDHTYGQPAELEKIDKLPEESRDNIRDQLLDIIMKNGEWEPKDALEEYPYEPTAAAKSDSELMEREQEAWDEQIEKYHQREAAAFGAHRGPVPGPGNPTGQEGGQQGDGSQQGGQQGSGQDGSDGGDGGESGEGSKGTYEPYQSSSNGSDDEVSTAGVSESALDFLRGGQGRQQPSPQDAQAQAPAQDQAQAQAQNQSQAEAADQAQTDTQSRDQANEAQQEQADPSQEVSEQTAQQSESPEDIQLDIRGIIAIEDLDKLEGTEVPVVPEEEN